MMLDGKEREREKKGPMGNENARLSSAMHDSCITSAVSGAANFTQAKKNMDLKGLWRHSEIVPVDKKEGNSQRKYQKKKIVFFATA